MLSRESIDDGQEERASITRERRERERVESNDDTHNYDESVLAELSFGVGSCGSVRWMMELSVDAFVYDVMYASASFLTMKRGRDTGTWTHSPPADGMDMAVRVALR